MTDTDPTMDHAAAMPEDGPSHGGDPGMIAEHEAMMKLVLDSEVTHRAVKDGAWSNPSTWAGGKVPGKDAVVLIGDGMDVTYDVSSSASIDKIRIDGELGFSTSKSTLLKVDTMVVTGDGRLEIGTEGNPIDGGVTARIMFADNGAVGHTSWDPTQLHRGLVAHGSVEMHGEEKASHVKLAIDPQKGQTKITLAEVADNWRPGDKIVLTGTEWQPNLPGGRTPPSQDEVLTIKSIVGKVVTFEEPLRYDHDTPAGDLKAYVANLSRSIVFESENADLHHRGHVMFMHNEDVQVANVAFLDLGRTDKSIQLDDRIVRPDGDAPGGYRGSKTPLDDVDNPRGRYPVHVHRAGDDIDGSPAVVEGSVVWGSPGWGFVSHDSYADFKDNVALEAYGAAYVAEVGNETGTWSRNISIGTDGRKPLRGIAQDSAAQDFAFEGDGFWINGRLIAADHNVAAGSRGAGFQWFGRGHEQLDVDVDNLDHPEIAGIRDHLPAWMPALEDFVGNEAFASADAISILRRGFEQGHDERSVIRDFIGWAVETGINISYSTNYLIRNARFYGAESNKTTTGLIVAKNSESVALHDVSFDGFDTGVRLDKIFDQPRKSADPDHQFAFIDVTFKDVGKAYGGKFNPSVDKVVSGGSLKGGAPRLVLDDDSLVIRWGSNPHARYLEIEGTKHDSLGAVRFPAANESIVVDANGINVVLDKIGYWTTLGGDRVTVLAVLFSDRATGQVGVQKFMAVFADGWKIPKDARYNGVFRGDDDVYVPRSLIDTDDFGSSAGDPGDDAVGGSDDGDTFKGGDGVDRFHGRKGDDRLEGLGGDDVLGGGMGEEVLLGGAGDDALTGHSGADVLDGGEGDDELRGDTGNDSLEGGHGDDVLIGCDGEDVLSGGAGRDRLNGCSGDDELRGGLDDDELQGGLGRDRLFGDAGDDRLDGGGDADQLDGGDGDDVLLGGDGDDVLRGSFASDRLDGGDGADSLYGDGGEDLLFGGDGDDRLDGGDMDDLLDGGAGDDVALGDNGDDVIFGGDGDDQLDGSSGNDVLDGGGGADRLAGGIMSDTLRGGADDDTLLGGDNGDVLVGGSGADLLDGGDGQDVLDGGTGVDVLWGRADLDTFVIDAIGADDVDRIMDYTVGERLRFDVLDGVFDDGRHEIDDFVRKVEAGGDVRLQVDMDGSGGSAGFVDAIVIVDSSASSLDRTVQEMLNNDLILIG